MLIVAISIAFFIKAKTLLGVKSKRPALYSYAMIIACIQSFDIYQPWPRGLMLLYNHKYNWLEIWPP